MRYLLILLFLVSCKSPTETENKICGTVYTEDDWFFNYTTHIIVEDITYFVESSDIELMYELNQLQLVYVCLYYNSIDGNTINIYDYK